MKESHSEQFRFIAELLFLSTLNLILGVSEGMVSDITDKLLPKIEEWQNRPLSPVYPIVFIDAVHSLSVMIGVIRKLAALWYLASVKRA